MLMIRIRRYLFTYFTWKTLSNHVFEDLRKPKAPNTTPKYTTSSDEGSSSDDEENLLSVFANLNMQQKEKLNELIGVIHEKDEILDSQEEFLIKENKKHVKVKIAYA
jgi:hypothetical protein